MSDRKPANMSIDELYLAVDRTKRKTVDLANEVLVLSAELRRRLALDGKPDPPDASEPERPR